MKKDTRKRNYSTKETKPRRHHYKPTDKFNVPAAKLWKPPQKEKQR